MTEAWRKSQVRRASQAVVRVWAASGGVEEGPPEVLVTLPEKATAYPTVPMMAAHVQCQVSFLGTGSRSYSPGPWSKAFQGRAGS